MHEIFTTILPEFLKKFLTFVQALPNISEDVLMSKGSQMSHCQRQQKHDVLTCYLGHRIGH